MIIKRSLRTSLLLLVILCGFLTFVVSSQTGLRWVYTVAQNFIPGTVTVDTLKGRLIGPIAITGLNYHADGLSVKVQQLHIDWQPRALFFSRFSIHQLQASGIHIQQHKTTASTDDNDAAFSLPANVALHHVSLRDISYQAGNDKPMLISQVLLQAKTQDRQLLLQQLAIFYQQYQLQAKGDLRLQPLTANLQASVIEAKHEPLQIKLHLHSQDDKTFIQSHFHQAFDATFKAVVHHKIEGKHWSIYGDVSSLYTYRLHHRLDKLAIAGSINASGDPNNTFINGKLTTDPKKHAGKYRANLSFTGHFRYLAKQTPIYALVHWQHLRWPLTGRASYTSPSGSIELNGRLAKYQLKLKSLLHGYNFPKTAISLQGDGTQQQFTMQQLHIGVFNGNLDGSAQLAWQPTLRWQTALTLKNIDFSSFWADWQTNLNGKLVSQGSQDKQGVHGGVTVNAISGNFHEAKLGGQLTANIAHSRLAHINADLTAGDARLQAKAVLDKNIIANWSLNIPHLNRLLPWATGDINTTGKITGAMTTPDIVMQLHVANSAWHDDQVDNLQIDGDIDLRESQPSQLNITARNLSMQQITLSQLAIAANGSLKKHRITADLLHDKQRLQLQADGGYHNKKWVATLPRFDLSSPDVGNWSLTKPAHLQYSDSASYLHDFCWQQHRQQVCLSSDWLQQQWQQATFQIKQLRLKPITHYFLDNAWLDSVLNGSGKLQRNKQQHMLGKLTARLTPGKFTYQPPLPMTPQDTNLISHVKKGELTIALTDNGLNSQLDFLTNSKNKLHLKVNLPNYHLLSSDLSQQSINATLQLWLAHLQLLPVLLPQFSHTDGQLAANLQLQGKLQQPTITGTAALKKATGFIDDTNTWLHDLNLNITGNTQTGLGYQGKGAIGSGKFTVIGNTQFKTQGVHTQLQLDGINLALMNTHDYKVTVSPNLTADITPTRFQLNGKVDVPSADFYIRNLSSTVKLPREAVIIDPDNIRQRPQAFQNFFADITLHLGDHISLKTDSFTSKLGGQLQLRDVPNKATTANGELRIIEGKFDAYGQFLTIENGKLLFVNSPIDNPALSIRAEKTISTVVSSSTTSLSTTNTTQIAPMASDITVGIDAKGGLQEPKLSLYSIPAGLSEADILSYLILGYPTSRAQSGQTQAIWQAANALQLGGLELAKIKKQLQDTFGLDLLAVEASSYVDPNTAEIQDNTSIVLGKMLSPRLFVSYSIGLVLPVNTFTASYKLSDNWSVKSDSGTLGTGADIVYTFDY